MATSYLLRSILRAANKVRKPRTLPALRPQAPGEAPDAAGTGVAEFQTKPQQKRKIRDDASTLPRLFCLRSPKPQPAPTAAEQALNRELADATNATHGSRTLILLGIAVVLLAVLVYWG